MNAVVDDASLTLRLTQVEDISRRLGRGDLQPLRALMARILVAEPTTPRLVEWAHAYPDRWAAMLTAIGRLSGLAERHIVEHGIRDVSDMSDAEIEERLAQLAGRVAETQAITRSPGQVLPHLLAHDDAVPAVPVESLADVDPLA